MYQGTSMSCPFVAGVVALMLEANPELTPVQIRDILIATAGSRSGTQWGAGKVNAEEALRKVLIDYPSSVDTTVAETSDASGVYSLSGYRVARALDEGSRLPSGVYILRTPDGRVQKLLLP